MTAKMKIDFVSDIVCPWCAVGLGSLQTALDRLGDEVSVDMHFQPFELNPQMPPEGQDIVEHIGQKYGSSADDIRRNGEAIHQRGAEVGFTFNMDKRPRIYNTFDAHRLLHWAELEGHQAELKKALLQAYFTDGKDPSNHEALVDIAGSVGLDRERAREILASDLYATEVRDRERFYLQQGIHSVPAVIINDRHLISGGQPVETFERALRQIIAEG
jgi:predicted DsbA family dithiol-disulfide isomerase